MQSAQLLLFALRRLSLSFWHRKENWPDGEAEIFCELVKLHIARALEVGRVDCMCEVPD